MILGRRNVATKEQLDYISGKRYEAQKNIDKFKGNQYTKKSGTEQNVQYQNPSRADTPTANKVAAIMGLTPVVVRRNIGFAKGIDAVKEVAPELADKILGEGPEWGI